MANYKYGIFTAEYDFMEYNHEYYGTVGTYDRIPSLEDAIANDPAIGAPLERFTTKEAAFDTLEQCYESYSYHYHGGCLYRYKVHFIADLETGSVLKVADYPM